jgi:hypothetical protein
MPPRMVAALSLAALAAVEARAQGLSGQNFSAMLAPRGGSTESDATGSSGTGWLDGEARYRFDRFTAILEATGGSYGSSTTLGGRGQLYWRDPSLALIGVLAETADQDGLTQVRTGVKGELYLGPFTVRGQGGYVFGDSNSRARISDSSYGVLSAGFYGISALALNGGALLQDGRATGFGGVEARIPGLPDFLTATLDGAAGANGYRQVLVGVRVYFGADATAPLQSRHVGQTPSFPAFDVGVTARRRPAAPPPQQPLPVAAAPAPAPTPTPTPTPTPAPPTQGPPGCPPPGTSC